MSSSFRGSQTSTSPSTHATTEEAESRTYSNPSSTMTDVPPRGGEGEDDNDSAIGEEPPSSATTSLASSIIAYPERHGRRYAQLGNWFVPNDEDEQLRMEMLDDMYRLVPECRSHDFDLNTDAPNILDIGTGIGQWAIAVADRYHLGQVIGTDLSPIQPTWVPRNCSFLVDDAECEWDYGKAFDLVHFRNMEGTFRDWRWIYKQALATLQPGGVVQTQSLDLNVYAQHGEVPCLIQQWITELHAAAQDRETPIDVAHRHADYLREAGFQDVKEIIVRIPLGTWVRSLQGKTIGTINLTTAVLGLEAYSMDLFVTMGTKSQAEVEEGFPSIREAYAKNCCKHQLYSKIVMTTGRKPHHP